MSERRATAPDPLHFTQYGPGGPAHCGEDDDGKATTGKPRAVTCHGCMWDGAFLAAAVADGMTAEDLPADSAYAFPVSVRAKFRIIAREAQ